jgi:A/G-specific adenine glycosylase
MDRSRQPAAGVRSALLRWYRRHRRDLPWRRTRDPYAIWVSEAMLQQTQVSTVLPYYERFLAAFPGVAELAEAPEEAVLGAWSGLGYYRRARALHAGARAVIERHGGRVPRDTADLLALPGVGPYTAGAIASIAFGLPEPALDGNVRRVLSRVLARSGSGAAEERTILRAARDLVRGPEPGDLNQALMELGALVCTPRSPRCGACPVTAVCLARASGDPEGFPVGRRTRRAVPGRVAVALIEHRGRVLLERRGPATPFRGAWDVPAAEVPEAADPVRLLRALLGRLGIRVRMGAEIARTRHAILNRRLRIEVFAGRLSDRVAPAPDGARWVRLGDLGSVAISGATRKVLRAAGRLVAEPGPGASQNRSQGGTQSAPRPPRRCGIGSRSSGRSKR